MKPEQALKLVDQICASVSLNREVHVKVQQAIVVLTKAIQPEEKPKKEEEKVEKKA